MTTNGQYADFYRDDFPIFGKKNIATYREYLVKILKHINAIVILNL